MPNHYSLDPGTFQHYATVGIFLTILGGVIQTKYQGANASEADDVTTVALTGVIYTCSLAWAIEIILRMRSIDCAAIFTYIALLLGMLAIVLRTFILVPAFGRFALAVWFVLLTVVARETYMQHPQFFPDAISRIKGKFTTLVDLISRSLNGEETPPPPSDPAIRQAHELISAF